MCLSLSAWFLHNPMTLCWLLPGYSNSRRDQQISLQDAEAELSEWLTQNGCSRCKVTSLQQYFAVQSHSCMLVSSVLGDPRMLRLRLNKLLMSA